MAFITFEDIDVALYADIPGTLVTIPTMSAAPWRKHYNSTLVEFDGDEWPTPFTGEGKTQSWDMQVTFGNHQHELAKALEDLFDLAHDSVDSRIQIRADTSTVPGQALYVVGVVHDLQGTPMPARPVQLSWTIHRTGDDF